MEILLFLSALLAVLLLIGELLTALIYLIVIVWHIHMKGYHIQRARNMKDRFFDTESRALTEACAPLGAVLRLYEDPDSELTGCLVSENLHQRITFCQKTLNRYGIIRRLRFVDVMAAQKKSGQIYRRWDHGGKEWRSCELGASALDEYISRSTGKVIHSAYYPSVQISFSMSRRLADDERRASTKKDKWGRKIVKDDSFYKDMHLEKCPSCGGELPETLKDVICPYCGSTIFSDYYDWQLETFEIEPQHLKLRGLIGWMVSIMTSDKNGARVKKRSKQKIVCFSEYDLRRDIYDSIMSLEDKDDLIDLWLGDIEIRKIINTENDTILKVAVPIHSLYIEQREEGNLIINNRKETFRASFARDRYPERFRKHGAVISDERCCPSCSAPFMPDENGNCIQCGAFLFKENYRWKLVER